MKYLSYQILALLSVCFLMSFFPVPVFAEYIFNATGTWEVTTSSDFDTCFAETKSITFDLIIVQNEDQFICTYMGNESAGTIKGPDYSVAFEYEEEGGIKNKKMKFTLSEREKGAGFCTWYWNDNDPNPEHLGHCEGFRFYELIKKSESTTVPDEESDDSSGSCFITVSYASCF